MPTARSHRRCFRISSSHHAHQPSSDCLFGGRRVRGGLFLRVCPGRPGEGAAQRRTGPPVPAPGGKSSGNDWPADREGTVRRFGTARGGKRETGKGGRGGGGA